MSEPDDNRPSLAALTSHDLLYIFGYLGYDDLLQCRLVCSHWYHIIKHEHRLIDRFRIGLTLDSGSVVSLSEPPFAIVENSRIKVKRITIKDDFLEAGNSIAVVEANRLKLLQLSEILRDKNGASTVTELIVHGKDDEPRTNALLFELIMEMKSLRVLRFTLTAFVHCLEIMCANTVEQCKSLEHVQIMHIDCKRLIFDDFQRLLRVFPNINRIDIKTYDTMLLGEDILHRFGHLIKSIEKLESYTLSEVLNVPNMLLKHISYEWCDDDDSDTTILAGFLNEQRELETVHLKIVHYTEPFLYSEIDRFLTDLELTVKKSDDSDEEVMKLGDLLKGTPNLKKLSVRYRGKHEFGHEVVQLKHLTDVTMRRYSLDCETCFITVLKSIANVTTLKFMRHSEMRLKQLTLISKHLLHLQGLQLMFQDSVELQNNFARWPAMPKLKTLIVNRVGHLTNKAIEKLRESCPMLEVLRFYSVRGRGAQIPGLLKLIFNSFPNLQTVTFRGGRCTQIPHLNYITGKVGCRLRELDISAYIQPAAIIKLFQNNTSLETVRCKYGSLVVTRRIYYEAAVLNAYSLDSMQQPLKNRKRLHMYEDLSSDSETSDSEESSSASSYETIDEDDDYEDEDS
ncbi:hypothetical protein HA402_004066 [Bradysia odoriphaga]|nr:hypothetical protein HA402_004066 [Bradysia odoriphaga]